MKVILQRDIPKVGKGGDVVTVADGYARNYLLPRSLAVTATGGALREHTARAEREKSRSAGQLAGAQADAETLRGVHLNIIGRTAPNSTKLYGSITAADIADAILKETGVTVDKRRIGVVDPIKTIGDYRVPVRLHSDVSVTLPVAVLTEAELQRRQALAAAEAVRAAETAAAAQVEESEETPAEADSGEAAEGAESEAAGVTA